MELALPLSFESNSSTVIRLAIEPFYFVVIKLIIKLLFWEIF